MHYYRFNIGDYKKDTGHLSIVEHGVYRQLIDLYYTNESPITADIRKLSRLISARANDEVQALNDVLDDFFTLDGDVYRHTRCDNELKSLYAKSEKARQSAQARWDAKSSKDANLLRTQCERNANACNNDANALKNDANRMLPSNPVTHEPSNPVTQLPINTIKPNNTPTKQHTVKPQAVVTTVDDVFNHWQQVMNHKRSKLDANRKKLITNALKIGYDVEQLKTAIDGCAKTSHNMGQNDRGQIYDGLHIIFKNADNIDRFIRNADTCLTRNGTFDNGNDSVALAIRNFKQRTDGQHALTSEQKGIS